MKWCLNAWMWVFPSWGMCDPRVYKISEISVEHSKVSGCYWEWLHIYTEAEEEVIQYADRKQPTVIRKLSASVYLFWQRHIRKKKTTKRINSWPNPQEASLILCLVFSNECGRKEGIEVKRGGKWKWPWEDLSQLLFITRDSTEAPQFGAEQTPEGVCLLTNENYIWRSVA